ncbi:MAG TPA: spermidine/putrescine ABC transporter substrate-binding protein [Kiritimatiellia bacterium]|nr:spermidine/putrescine ABC transporter substrate-binding protein [Kiritimatiellia bacterium]HMO97488.1 spermidine/putrescine ABC transporter substrate-binding protein [Kiritimatiellia bacterium]HMP96297.1 spermidine/putrescine ABC transporter substrate-binding protein [Kiritimatiellia bacterium]
MTKKLMLGVIALGLAGIVSGCGAGKPRLHLYTWADYVDPALVKQFEKEFNCRVVIDTFDSNEAMFAKLQAGATGYDLIIPSSYMIITMNRQGMLQPINKELIPNLKYVDPDHLKYAKDKDMDHSVPYMVGHTGIAYLESRVENVEPSWAMFDREDLRGRITLLNDMRETIGAALKFLGYSLNTTNENELAEARDVVIRWKRNIAKFDNEQYKVGLASGAFLLVQGYSGDIVQVMEDNEDIVFVTPQEGTSTFSDDFVIPNTAKQVELAHAYINFMHDPENAAANIEYIAYLCPNIGAYELLSDEIKEDPTIFMDPEIRARSEFIDDVGEALALYTRMWDEIKAAD